MKREKSFVSFDDLHCGIATNNSMHKNDEYDEFEN